VINNNTSSSKKNDTQHQEQLHAALKTKKRETETSIFGLEAKSRDDIRECYWWYGAANVRYLVRSCWHCVWL